MSETVDLRMIEAAELELAERSLHEFIRQAYHVVKPGETFVDNWHIDAICQHLEYGARNPRYDCTINVPPGAMKSLTGSVFFPCWVWTWRPDANFFVASYSYDFAVRDATRRRALLRSEWFQERWGKKCWLTKELENRLVNNHGGEMLTTSVGGQATGVHPHFLLIDDAHNLAEVESDVKRKIPVDWFSQALTTRGLQIGVSRFLLNQRSHTEDLPGHVMKLGFDALVIPMEYEGPEEHPPTKLGWVDPRTTVGELMWPALFPPRIVEEIKRGLVTQYRIASQLQQRPVPREGGLFKLAGFNVVQPEVAAQIKFDQVVRYWDRAYTKDAGDYSAGALMGQATVDNGLHRWYVLDVKRGQWSPHERNQTIVSTAWADQGRFGNRYKVWFEQEGNAGKETAPILVNMLKGIRAEAHRITGASGDKVSRAAPFADQHEAGHVSYVAGDHLQCLIDELSTFPAGKYDDQVDACASAFTLLAQPRKKFFAYCN